MDLHPLFEAVFILLAGLTLLHLASSIVGTAVFLYARGEPLFPVIPPAKGGPWRQLAASVGREVAARTLIRVLSVAGLAPERLPREDAWDGAHPPVILLHGYNHNRAATWPLMAWLRRKGWAAFTLDHAGVDTIEGRAHRLKRRVEVIRQITGAPRVDLVGHSMGGLVARYYVEQLDGASAVGRLITLGTPHRGTGMAIFGRGEVAAQLLPASPVITTLAQSLDGAREVQYTAIAGTLDTLVFPLSAALLGPPHDDRVLDGLGHNTLLVHGAAFNAVRDALSRGEVAAPQPSQPLLETA